MKNKTLVAVALISCLSFSATSFAGNGGKVPPPNGQDKIEVVWYQPILDLLKL